MTQPGDVGSTDRVDVVVLTALDLEYAAVRAHLSGLATHADANGTRYETGEISDGRGRVALVLTGPGNLSSAALATRAVMRFRPKALVLVGVAGGLADEVVLGDVVVATRVHDYQSGRAAVEGFRPRPKSWPLSHGLEQDARDVARDGTWARRLPADEAAPAVHFKPLVSGEVLLDASDGLVAKLIAEHYNDAVAIDMESAGVAEAAHRNDFHRTITVRAVSDRADGTKQATDATGWQRRAVDNAAAFAVALAERVADGPGSTRPAGTSPYRGLAAFGESDAELFFGRADAADELASLVPGRRFVAVAGRSGSGKSSLVHAGLIPRMRPRGWAVAAFRPLPEVPGPVTLAGALLPLLQPGLAGTETLSHKAILADAIADGRLAEVLGDVLAATGASRLLVCVDQFEELVAWRAEAARELVELLVRLSTGGVPVHVVLTVRMETLDVAVHQLGLGEVIGRSVFLLTPMSTAQLREAVEEPVRSTGVRFESGLATRIVEAARDAPGALPLTQFALTRLWDEQDHGLLTHHVYDGFGGVAGALASYAEQVWAEQLDDTQRDQARRLLVQLVRPEGDGAVRRTARGDELTPEQVALARHLATTRLLVTGTDAAGELTVDLAHAALVTHWRRLRDWVAEERDFRSWQEDLRESVRRAEPLRSVRLTTALRWLRTHRHALTMQERDFVLASRRRQRVRTTAWRGLLSIVVVLLVAASTLAVSLQRRGERLADELSRSAAQLLVTEAGKRLGSDPDTAALLSVAAYRTSQEPAALANLAGEYQRHRDSRRMVDPGVGQLNQVSVSADGRTAAVAGLRGAAVLRLSGDPVVIRRADDVELVAVSPDGQLVAAGTNQGHVELWQPDGKDDEVTVLSEDSPATNGPVTLRFDGGGTQLLAASDEGLAVWDLMTGKELPVSPNAVTAAKTYPDAVRFGPDGQSIVVASDREVGLWPLTGGQSTVFSAPPGSAPLISGDGNTAVICSTDTIEYWDLRTVAAVGSQPGPELSSCAPDSTFLDHSGRYLLDKGTVEDEGHARDAMWLLDRTEATQARFVAPAPADDVPGVVTGLAATSTGARMVTAVGSALILVDLARPDFAPNTGAALNPLISPDLRHATTRSTDPSTVYLWNAATGEQLAAVNPPDGVVPDQFTSDGAHLVGIDGELQFVNVLTVPSLRAAKVAMHPGLAKFQERYHISPGGLCVAQLADPDEVAIVINGLAMRLNARTGSWSGDPLPLGRTDDELTRLDIWSCRGRPDHNEIALASKSGVVLWRLDDRDRTILPVTAAGPVDDVGFSQDGRRLAVLGDDGSMEIWDVERRQLVHDTRKVLDPGSTVGVVGFAGNQVVVYGDDVMRVWDPDAGAVVAEIFAERPDTATVSPDGAVLAYWSSAGLTRMPLTPQEWANHLCRVVARDLTKAERRLLQPGSFTGPIC